MSEADSGGAGEGGLQGRLDALRRAFRAKVPVFASELRAAAESVEAAPDAAARESALDVVRRQAHRVAGTAATYGMDDLADAHRRAERAAGASGNSVDPEKLWAAVADVERIAADVGADGDT